MLPFLKDKKQSIADVITASRAPDAEDKPSDENEGMLAAAHDLIQAVHAKDAKAVAAALQAAHEMADEPSEPEELE